MKKILTIFLFLSIAYTVKSQGNKFTGFTGFFMGGYAATDANGLINRLQNYGYPSFHQGGIAVGGSGFAVYKNILIGGEGFSFSSRGQNSLYQTGFDYGLGFFNLGYLIPTKRKMVFYPKAGIGSGGFTLKIRDRQVTPDFGQILLASGRGSEFTAGTMVLNLSLNLVYFTLGGEKSKGGLAMGLTAGGYFSPRVADWQYMDTALAGAPDTRINGWYLSILIGGGGIVSFAPRQKEPKAP
jgi:hypothetical protein